MKKKKPASKYKRIGWAVMCGGRFAPLWTKEVTALWRCKRDACAKRDLYDVDCDKPHTVKEVFIKVG